MMKWGERKPSSGSSSSSHASPFYWLSKFKKMSIKHKAKHGDDNALWRASFGEENHGDRKSKDINENVIPSSSGRRNAKKHGRREGTLKLKEKDIGVGEERKLLHDRKVSLEMDEYNREKEYEYLRRRFERKAQKVLQEQLLKLEREAKEVEFASSKAAVEKDVMQFESPTTICTPRTHSFASNADSKYCSLRGIIEDRVFRSQNSEKIDRPTQNKLSSEWQNLKQSKEMKVKTTKQKQPLHVSRELQGRKPKHSRVRIYSPRMPSKVEIYKIKALEDKRKAKIKVKKEREETPGIDSFAVIKCSSDPKKDFRDSMIEMITERQISHPEEMEELLACYLTLNADEYHDLIIKVFRQLWFEMSKDGLGIISDICNVFSMNNNFCLVDT